MHNAVRRKEPRITNERRKCPLRVQEPHEVLGFTFFGEKNGECFVSYSSLSLSSTKKQRLPSSGHSRPCGAPCSRAGPYFATRTARWAVAPCTPPIKELPYGGRQSFIRKKVSKERTRGGSPPLDSPTKGALSAPLGTPPLDCPTIVSTARKKVWGQRRYLKPNMLDSGSEAESLSYHRPPTPSLPPSGGGLSACGMYDAFVELPLSDHDGSEIGRNREGGNRTFFRREPLSLDVLPDAAKEVVCTATKRGGIQSGGR